MALTENDEIAFSLFTGCFKMGMISLPKTIFLASYKLSGIMNLLLCLLRNIFMFSTILLSLREPDN